MDAVERAMSEAAGPLRKLYDEAAEEKDRLAELVAENRAQLTRLTRALKAVDPEFAEAESKPKQTKKKPMKFVPSEASLDAIEKAIRDGAETVQEITGATDVSDATVRNGVDVLRERRLIRKAGHRANSRGKPVMYKPLPKEEAPA